MNIFEDVDLGRNAVRPFDRRRLRRKDDRFIVSTSLSNRFSSAVELQQQL